MNTETFVVGDNEYGQLGLGHDKEVKELTPSSNTSICNVYPGYGYTICSDKDHENLWATGDNREGQCWAGKDNKKLWEWTPIKHFKENSINVHRICVSVFGKCTFFISDKKQLFGAGRNWDGMLGLNEIDKDNQYEPVMIQQLQNVLDVQSGWNFCVAICGLEDSNLKMITSNWCRNSDITTPEVILDLLLEFARWNTVYSTTNERGSGHQKDSKLENECGWNEVEVFKDKQIIQSVSVQIILCFWRKMEMFGNVRRIKMFPFKFHILRRTASELKIFRAEDITVWLSMMKDTCIHLAVTGLVNVETQHVAMPMNQKWSRH